MRMRRKKNLEEKIADLSAILLCPRCAELDNREAIKNKEYIDYRKYFNNDNPVFLEIGCGKGKFAIESAQKHPENNYIAMEKSANVIYEGCAKAKELSLKNLLFVNLDAKILPKYFAPDSISGIYLNFSCPYPQNAYSNRRLTNPRFIAYYGEILKNGGKIYQKTDNAAFFEYSKQAFTECGYNLEFVTDDLHGIPDIENIMTEYEKKFSEMGFPIHALIASR